MKTRVGIIFGGKSGEHEVSLRSAAAIIQTINKEKYDLVPIGITRSGRLASREEITKMLPEASSEYLSRQISIQSDSQENKLLSLKDSFSSGNSSSLDVVIPVLHGPYGEDGTIQGLLELSGVPYVGCCILSSALGMDKILMKKLWSQASLPIVEFITCSRREWKARPKIIINKIEAAFRYPCFVKPVNLGSSIGVTKVHSRDELPAALDLASNYDRKIIIERAVDARELECSVLGNDEPIASVVGEVVPAREFYDYEAKYNDPRTRLIIPAAIDDELTNETRTVAVQAFRELDCSGLARVDFLLDRKTRKLYLNEINTMPGFTSISMYPRLWEASGIPLPDLIDQLIHLAFERHQQKIDYQVQPC